MKSKQIFISRQLPIIAEELLSNEGFDVKSWPEERPMRHEELLAAVHDSQGLLCTGGDRIDEEFLKSCSHLEVVSTYAVGYDNIDIQAAQSLKIAVGHTPGVLTDATADIAFALLLAVSRKLFFQHKRIARGDWQYFRPTAYLGQEITGKTLGIFGLGEIGFAMAKRCHLAYDMPIIYHNRTRNLKAETDLNATFVDFETLLKRSDVLSVHTSLNPQTKGIFNRLAFQKMKPNAIFINTARGGVHNESDLLQALQQGNIWGAGLDVTNPEPMSADSPLLQMENVAVLPHIGSATHKARNGMAQLAAENIIAFFREGKVKHAAG